MATLIQRSSQRSEGENPNRLYVDLYESGHFRHFSYISDMSVYAHDFKCPTCGWHHPKSSKLNWHATTCTEATTFFNKGGVYHPPKSLAQLTEELDLGVEIPQVLKVDPFRATFDIETKQPRVLEGEEEQTSSKRRSLFLRSEMIMMTTTTTTISSLVQ